MKYFLIGFSVTLLIIEAMLIVKIKMIEKDYNELKKQNEYLRENITMIRWDLQETYHICGLE